MPEAPMTPGTPPDDATGGGDINAAINQLGEGLAKIAGSDLPPEAKKAFDAALQAFTAGAQILSGGGSQAAGATTPEQGASGAQPMSMQRPQ